MKKVFFGGRVRAILGMIAVIPLLFSCQSQKGWVYNPNRWKTPEKSLEKVYVHTFQDSRSRQNQEASLLYILPAIPFGWQKLSMPEHIQQHILPTTWENFNPTVDFAKALVKEMKSGSHFKEVVYTDNIVKSAYRIQGRIVNTDYKSKVFSYCLSVGGILLWPLGFPAGSFSNNLEIELTCYDANDNVFFKKTYHPKLYKKTVWIYRPKGDFEYASLLKNVYADFIRDFNNQLQHQ